MDPRRLAQRLSAAAGSLEAVRAVLREEVDAAALAPPVPELHPYARRILAQDAEVEVMLARWRAGATCAPHDHGSARGWVCFLEGAFVERAYSWTGKDWVPGEVVQHAAGDVAEVRAGAMHDCTSVDGGLSLHVYFPRITGMQVLSLPTRQTFVVADDAGAWVPADSSSALRVVDWS